MKNIDAHEELILWLGELLGLTVIKDRQGADRPAVPYAMVDLANWRDLSQHAAKIDYRESTDLNTEGKRIVMARPDIEIEWTFMLFVYGPNADEYVRRLQASYHFSQVQERLIPDIHIHEISAANSIPELIDEKWEPRVQVNLIVRGKASDEFVADVIEQTGTEVEIERF